jgi:hypothetical protein
LGLNVSIIKYALLPQPIRSIHFSLFLFPPIAQPFVQRAQKTCLACLLFGADGGSDGSGLRAAIDLLHAGSAVARSIASSAVKLLASLTSGEDVVLVGEGVTPLTRYVNMAQNRDKYLNLRAELVVNVVGL